MAKALRYKESDASLESNLKLIDCHLPQSIHKSKHRFLKNFPNPKKTKFYYCYDCEAILDFSNVKVTTCTSCNKEFKKSAMDISGQYFIHVPLKPQLLELIESKTFENYKKIDDNVEDIINSKLYKYLQSKNIIGENDISLSWNTDGISLFKSSKKSTWSILVRINELPYRISKDNILLSGLWHDKRKPIMKMFLKPFSDELVDLYENGIECRPYMTDHSITIKVHAILCCVDTIARPTIQNMIQFNGAFGCPYCLHEGETLSEELGSARVYCKKHAEDRTHELYEQHVQLSIETNTVVKGVKGPSVMKDVPNLDTLRCYPPEYMHAWLLGVGRMFINAWLDSKNHGKDYYIGTRVNELNERLLKILPPCEITRTPHDLLEKMKAAEIKNFSAYYSVIVLFGILPDDHYKHWLLFSESLYILLKPTRSDEEFLFAERSLIKFHDGIEKLYGDKYMTFNVHTLVHACKFVKYYGCLWSWSAFPFEHYNSVIKCLYHGTQCIIDQICKSYFRLKYIKSQSSVFQREDCDAEARSLFIKLMNECRVKNCISYNDDLRLFYCKNYTLTELEEQELEIQYQDTIERIKRCDRFIYNNILFHSKSYKKLQKRNNSCFISNDGQIYMIDKLIKFQTGQCEDEKVAILAKQIEVLNESLGRGIPTPRYIFIGRQSPNLTILNETVINQKCICMPFSEGKVVVIPLVNRMETD